MTPALVALLVASVVSFLCLAAFLYAFALLPLVDRFLGDDEEDATL